MDQPDVGPPPYDEVTDIREGVTGYKCGKYLAKAWTGLWTRVVRSCVVRSCVLLCRYWSFLLFSSGAIFLDKVHTGHRVYTDEGIAYILEKHVYMEYTRESKWFAREVSFFFGIIVSCSPLSFSMVLFTVIAAEATYQERHKPVCRRKVGIESTRDLEWSNELKKDFRTYVIFEHLFTDERWRTIVRTILNFHAS